MYYTEEYKRKLKYIFRRISELENGQTISPQLNDGYPFQSYIDRFGNIKLSEEELKNDFICNFLNDNPDIKNKVDLIEIAWQFYIIYGTPNGNLFRDNTLFKTIREGKGLTLLHCTAHLPEIINSGYLYPSGGCLGASLYCVPLRSDGETHNLGKFIIENEMPNSLSKSDYKEKEVDLLAIKISPESFIHSNEESNGLDYLLMGKLQLELYNQFKIESGVETQLFNEVEKEAVEQVKKSMDFLNFCAEYKIDRYSDEHFIKLFEEACQNLSIMGYIYFEVLVEYVTLFQDDDFSTQLKQKGEINNYYYKQMVFDLVPEMYSGFKLVNFKPKVEDVVQYFIKKAKNKIIFNYFLEDHFLNFFKWRTAQYIRYKILDTKKIAPNIGFDVLSKRNPSLLGHILHREIRVNKKLKSCTDLYDEMRAVTIWKVWNKSNVLYPYNSIVPKGEIGINPGFPYLDYEIYRAKLNKQTKLNLRKN